MSSWSSQYSFSSVDPAEPYRFCCRLDGVGIVGVLSDPDFLEEYAECGTGYTNRGQCVFGFDEAGVCRRGSVRQVLNPATYFQDEYWRDMNACLDRWNPVVPESSSSASFSSYSSYSSFSSYSSASYSSSSLYPGPSLTDAWACHRGVTASVPYCPAYTVQAGVSPAEVTLFFGGDVTIQNRCTNLCSTIQTLVQCCQPLAGCGSTDAARCTGAGFVSFTGDALGRTRCTAAAANGLCR